MKPQTARILLHSINTQPLDYEKNIRLVLQSILIAKQTGCVYRPSNELEITGYGCEDHYFEKDLADYCWESLASIIRFNKAIDNRKMLVEISFPLNKNGNMYNCTALILYDKILGIRPKESLAEEEVYNEMRYFNSTKWKTLKYALHHKENILEEKDNFLGSHYNSGVNYLLIIWIFVLEYSL